MSNIKQELIGTIKELPDKSLKEVLNFAKLLKREKEQAKKYVFKTAKLGKMKHFERSEIYDEYLSNRF